MSFFNICSLALHYTKRTQGLLIYKDFLLMHLLSAQHHGVPSNDAEINEMKTTLKKSLGHVYAEVRHETIFSLILSLALFVQ